MYWHLTFAAPERWPLCATDEARLAALRGIGRIGPRLLLFCLVDDHAHLVVRADRAGAADIARGITQVLGATAGCAVRSRCGAVDGRSHLYELVPYVLRQPVRHDLGVHPGAWSGSCLWDLVGARALEGFDPDAIRRELPRLGPLRFWTAVGLPEVGALTPAELRSLGPLEVLRGAAGALVATGFDGTPASVDARAIAVQLCLEAGLRQRVVAADLGLAERGIRRLNRRAVPVDRLGVVHRQLAIRLQLRTATPVYPSESERRGIERSRVLSGQSGARNRTEVADVAARG